MISEYDLACANCDGPLVRHEVDPESVDAEVAGPVPVAECEDCGTRYYPTEALERIGVEVG